MAGFKIQECKMDLAGDLERAVSVRVDGRNYIGQFLSLPDTIFTGSIWKAGPAIERGLSTA